MSNTGVVKFTQATPGEFPVALPKVYVNGEARPDYVCLKVEKTSGIVPGKAILQWIPYAEKTEREEKAPITLNAYDVDSKELHGSRVVITTNGETIFCGHILLRQDSGADDAVIWTAFDDRDVMSKIPIRGAVVKDDSASTVQFLPRYTAHTNPSGAWNCVGWTCDISGHPLNGEVVPVFTSRGWTKVSYESPDEVFPSTLSPNVVVPWTPRHFLTYLYFIAHLQPGDMPGITSWSTEENYVGISYTTWRGLKHARGDSYDLFDWKYDSIKGLNGRDSADTGLDPLDRKMADMNFQGLALLQGIIDTLTNAGTHEISFEPKAQTTDTEDEEGETVKTFNGKAKTLIDFYAIGKTAAMADETTFNSIQILREGRPSNLPNVNTAYDFILSEDSTNTRMACFVEGDVIRSETRVTIDNGLKVAWSDAEETAFKQIIWGSESSSTTNIKYAWYPQGLNLDNSDIPATSEWVQADGTSGKELAYAYSAEAVQIARRLFPRVYRAFYIDSTNQEIIDALKGYGPSGDEPYKDTDVYPQGKIDRPVLPNQLQYQLADLNAGGDVSNKLAAKLPIRVTVENDDGWKDAGWTSAQMIGGGIFLIDLAEQFDDTPQCIYSGHLYSTGSLNPLTTLDCAVKNVRINLAIPMDHRVSGYAETSGKYDDDGRSDYMYLNANYSLATGGEFMQYVDTGETYKEEHQVNSYPTDDGSVKNRLLPPGSEASNARYAAQRRLYQTQKINRLSSWKMVGIRPEWKIGMWIDQVNQITVDDEGKFGEYGAPYRINGPIRSLVFDFYGNQDTTIGGLIGESQ